MSFTPLSFKGKNTVVIMASFSLLLIFFSLSVLNLFRTDSFTETNVFPLFGVVIVWSLGGTVLAMILRHLIPLLLEVRRTGNPHPEVNQLEDEFDRLIDLRGTRLTSTVFSLGSFIATLTYVFGQPPLVMFTLLIFFGLLAQIAGDGLRLLLYRWSAQSEQ